MPIANLTSDDLAIACILSPHEWTKEFEVTHIFGGDVTTGKTGRESRRPEAEELMHTLAVHLVLRRADAQAFRQMLATVGKGWIGLPLWPDRLTGARWADRIYEAGRILDLTAVAIQTAAAARNDAHTYAPLLVGHIDELPELPLDDEEMTDFSFTIVEDSPWDFRLSINATGTPGTWPAALVPDASEPITDQPQNGLTFERIGLTRERTIEGEDMPFRWGQEATFTLRDRAAIRTLLAFFEASQGRRKSFDTPWWFKPGTPTAEAPASTKARFGASTLTLSYLSGVLALARVAMLQVPWEILGVEGETPEQPPRVHYYRFTHLIPAQTTFRFTSWRRPLARTGDGTYAPAPMKHKVIEGGLDLKTEKVTVESFKFSGNPLGMFNPCVLEAPLLLEIFETENEPVNPDAAVLIWAGLVTGAPQDGRQITATALFLAGLLDREVPGVLISTNCQTYLFSTRCGLLKAAFAKSGTFTAKADNVLTIATAAGDAAQTFVPGWIEIGSGDTWELRAIIASTPVAGGQQLVVDWPVRQAAAGQAVVFYVGCDRTWARCQALGNSERFRGHPNLPLVNLSLPTGNSDSPVGKK